MAQTTAVDPSADADDTPPTPSSPREALKANSASARERRFGRKLLLPAFVVSVLVTQVPFLVTIYYSFQDWNLQRPDDRSFAGFDNYVTVFTGGTFIPAMISTIIIVGGSVLLSLILGLGLATLLDRKFVGQAFARTLLITPFLVMPAAAALIWKWTMLDANVGMVNWALDLVGIPAVAWNTDFPIVTIIAVLTWQYTPFMMLILLAGLQSQSGEILEAASVDGAGGWRIFTAMTLPHLKQYLILATVLGTIMMIQVFDPVAIMTRGTGGTKTLSYLLYERAFIGLEVGEAAAYGVVTVILTIIVATLALRSVFKFLTEEGSRS
ncbi:carbohydrate ABC transporter permease [Solicola sp. PLA-1-18]|uniref:carbohydrate ABC transporter permease n=1 Tax=Solicola sp. PLA-1-18 TaxID=3380532 RepID=UPI003B7AE831